MNKTFVSLEFNSFNDGCMGGGHLIEIRSQAIEKNNGVKKKKWYFFSFKGGFMRNKKQGFKKEKEWISKQERRKRNDKE